MNYKFDGKLEWYLENDLFIATGVLIPDLGTYTDAEGKQLTIDEKFVNNILSNVSKYRYIPFVFSHEENAPIIGAVVKVGSPNNKVPILYKAVIFDREAQELIRMGYTDTSALLTDDGQVVHVALVYKAAMEGAGLKEVEVFAMGDDEVENKIEKSSVEENPVEKASEEKVEDVEEKEETEEVESTKSTAEELEKKEEPKESEVKHEPTIQSDQSTIQPDQYDFEKLKSELEQLKSEYVKLKTEYDSIKHEYETIKYEYKSKELNNLINELKNIGFIAPEKLIEDFDDIDLKINVLRKVKISFAAKEVPKDETTEIEVEEKEEVGGVRKFRLPKRYERYIR